MLYQKDLVATGSHPITNFSVVAGDLDGLTLDGATGRMSGTPAAAGVFTPTIQVTDALGRTESKTFQLEIGEASAPDLLFASDRSGRFQVWKTDVGASPVPEQITTGGSGSQESRVPDWTGSATYGDAGQVAYHFGASGVRGIHMLPTDDPDADVRLTLSTGDERDASWSPDGRFIVYASQPTSATHYDLWVHDVGDPTTTADDTDAPLWVSASQSIRPTWSPDGTRIAFTTSGGPVGIDAEIASVDVTISGGTVSVVPGSFRNLTQNAFADFDPTWSPDGTQLAYSTARNGNRDIYRMRHCLLATGCEFAGNFDQLTTSADDDTNPDWSPDGRTIAFTSRRTMNPDVFVMSAVGGESVAAELRQITSDPATDDDASWALPAPVSLAFRAEPATPVTSQHLLPIQPVVEVRGTGGSVQTSDNSTVVTLNVAATGLSTLTCTGGLSQTVVSGVATFSGCTLSAPYPGEDAVVIRASAAGAEPADTAPLDLGPARLTLETAPPLAVATSTSFGSPVAVAIRDAAGVIDAADNTMTVDLAASPGSAGALSCAGGLSVTVAAGVATFPDCTVDQSGGYDFVATSAGLPTIGAGSTIATDATLLALGSSPLDLFSVSPTTAVAGSGGLTLTVEGAGFGPSSEVTWGGSARPTTLVSATELHADLDAADLVSSVVLRAVPVTVRDSGTGAETAPVVFTVTATGVTGAASEQVGSGDAGTASLVPVAAGESGATATLTNLGDPFAPAGSVSVATYSGNPTTSPIFDAGGGFVDILVAGADPASLVQAAIYYPSTVTGAPEAALQLLYWTGGAWSLALGAGGAAPTKDTTDDLDGSVSGGRFSLTFDDTSTPKVTELTGTVFTSTIPATGNRPPTAAPDAYATDEDVTLSVAAPGVLGNDTDPDPGDTRVAVQVAGPANGALVLNSNGSFAYTPGANFHGTDTFRYQAEDAAGALSSEATATITVRAVNDPPVSNAGPDLKGGEGVAIPVHGVAADVDGAIPSTSWSVKPKSGTDSGASCTIANPSVLDTSLTCNDDGIYTLSLRVTDGFASPVTDTATVTVANARPAVTLTSPADGSLAGVGIPVHLSASFSDAGTNDSHTCSVAWGDGATTSGQVTEAAGSGRCTAPHTYSRPGITTAVLTVKDDDGGSTPTSLRIDVRDNDLSGGAFGEQVRLSALLGIVSSGPTPTVSLPAAGGGPFTKATASVGVPLVLQASGLEVSTQGTRSAPDASARSSAKVAGATIGAGIIRLEGVRSECSSTGTGSRGSTQIAKLVVNGQTILDLATSRTIEIPGVGSLIVNEQLPSGRAPSATQFGRTDITVNAVHLKLLPGSPLGSGDVILAQSRCGIEGPSVR